MKLVASEIILSLAILNEIKPIKDFDKDQFKNDMVLFLKSKNYLNG